MEWFELELSVIVLEDLFLFEISLIIFLRLQYLSQSFPLLGVLLFPSLLYGIKYVSEVSVGNN
jgi:hypothetical protein